jgi:uncharacterized protein YuzE
MAAVNVYEYLRFLPTLQDIPTGNVWLNYDAEADVLYVNFMKSVAADDSELTDDVILRYDGDDLIGFTVLHASQRR